MLKDVLKRLDSCMSKKVPTQKLRSSQANLNYIISITTLQCDLRHFFRL